MISIQKQLWLQRANLLNEEKKLSDAEIDKILKRLRHEDEEEEKKELKESFEDDSEELFEAL
ncbi:MAG: hypothetical protein WCG15_00945, partial [Actinomycetes bacterium]